MMKVCYIVDNNYFEHFLVSLNSLLRNKMKSTSIELHLVLNGIPQHAKSLLQKFESDDVELHIYDGVSTGLKTTYANCEKHFSDTVYTRLILHDMLQNIRKILYIDCDTIVKRDLGELWKHDVSAMPFAAVKEYAVSQVLDNFRAIDYMRNGLPSFKERYFNSGVLLMNLEYLRICNSFKKCQKMHADHPEFKYADQDILNWLYIDSYLPVHPKFNFQVSMYFINHFGSVMYNDDCSYIQKYNKHYGVSYENFMQAYLDASILHYVGNKQRIFQYDILKQLYDSEKQHLVQFLAKGHS